MMDLNYIKEHLRMIVILLLSAWVGVLIILTLLASAVDGFPTLTKEPRVIMTEAVPTATKSDCTIIGDTQICPEPMVHPQ